MSEEEQAAIIGAKVLERQQSRRRLQCLVDRATGHADECLQIAYELNKAAGKEDPGEHIPGKALRTRGFVSGEEFDTLVRELEAERKRLADIDESLRNYGLD